MTFDKHPGFKAAQEYMEKGGANNYTITFSCALVKPGIKDTVAQYIEKHPINPDVGLFKIGQGPCHATAASMVCSTYAQEFYRKGGEFQYFCEVLRSGGGSQKARRAFYDFIFDKDKSPWRKLFKDREPVSFFRFKKDNVAGNTVPDWFALAIDNNTSAPLLFNFLIATRMPYEHTKRVKVWYDLVTDGVEPCLALILCSIPYVVPTISNGNLDISVENTEYMGYNIGHYPITVTNVDVMLKNLRDGTPFLKDDMALKDMSGYMPNNAIWYATKANEYVTVGAYYGSMGFGPKLIVWLNAFKAGLANEAKKAKPIRAHIFQSTTKVYVPEVMRLQNKNNTKSLDLSINKLKEHAA